MARIMVMHSESGPRAFVEARVKRHHDVMTVKHIPGVVKGLPKFKPDLILAQLSPKKMEALDLLRQFKRDRTSVPVLVVGEAAAARFQPIAMKLGAVGFVEYPMEQDALDQAISHVLQNGKDVQGDIPPICQEELQGNITDMELQLNRHMTCFAGKNQVYIQSLIVGAGRVTKPRLALKCPLRKQLGQKPDVYYEFIRDVCCGDPSACSAYQHFQKRVEAAS